MVKALHSLKNVTKDASNYEDPNISKKRLSSDIFSLIEIIIGMNDVVYFYAGKTKKFLDKSSGRYIWDRESSNKVLMDQGDKARESCIEGDLSVLLENRNHKLAELDEGTISFLKRMKTNGILPLNTEDAYMCNILATKGLVLTTLGTETPGYEISPSGIVFLAQIKDKESGKDPWRGHTLSCSVRVTSMTCNCGRV